MSQPPTDPNDAPAAPEGALELKHLRFGWGSLLVFVLLGAVLEAMHGFKVDWYLAVGNETQRLLWRLGHAHGAMLSLVHLGFAVSTRRMAGAPLLASRCLVGASVALPGGFLLGAFGSHGGDPGLGIALVPLGLVLLVIGVGGCLRALRA